MNTGLIVHFNETTATLDLDAFGGRDSVYAAPARTTRTVLLNFNFVSATYYTTIGCNLNLTVTRYYNARISCSLPRTATSTSVTGRV